MLITIDDTDSIDPFKVVRLVKSGSVETQVHFDNGTSADVWMHITELTRLINEARTTHGNIS